MKTAVILASSRKNGNTHQLVQCYINRHSGDVFDLSDFEISVYDYEHHNSDDDFIKLINRLLKYDRLVFATPVYWYAMSAQMKVFFDRLSDLLTVNKQAGRRLRGKSCFVLATGTDDSAPQCFAQPFRLTCDYLAMRYLGMLYCKCDPDFDKEQHIEKIRLQLDKII